MHPRGGGQTTEAHFCAPAYGERQYSKPPSANFRIPEFMPARMKRRVSAEASHTCRGIFTVSARLKRAFDKQLALGAASRREQHERSKLGKIEEIGHLARRISQSRCGTSLASRFIVSRSSNENREQRLDFLETPPVVGVRNS